MLFLTKNHNLQRYITHTLLAAITLIFIISFIAGILIAKSNTQLTRIDKIHETHTTLMSIIAPELSIYNIMEVRKLLSLSSSKDIFFAVIDNNKNIYMSDYGHLKIVTDLLPKHGQIDCADLNKQEKKLNLDYFFYCSSIHYPGENTNDNVKLGVLVSYSQLHFVFRSWILLIESLLVFLLISALLFIFIRRELHKRLLSPLIKLESQIDQLDYANLQEKTHLGDIGWTPVEVHKIKEAFNQLLSKLHLENIRILEAEKKATLSNLAVQIAHDIRSPLAALEVLLVEIKTLPEKKRLLVKHAINRINDIANNLLTQYRSIQYADKIKMETQISSELVSALIDMVISEKRLQINGHHIEISFKIHKQAHGTCVNINPSLFKRVLSNILNNAIESISEKGKIRVSLENSAGNARIQICDNGCGIPEKLLPLLRNGTSHGKTDGSGIGLSSAIQKIQSWNGTLTIHSKEQQGTTVEICLPLAKPPAWFAEQIFFSKHIKQVIIVDDEESVHQIWNNRFEKLSENFDFKMIHFNSPRELIHWCKDNSNNYDQCLFLIDYQFENSKSNGIRLIRKCNIEENSLLVTSCYETEDLREKCLLSGVKLLPKFFSAYIPIEVTEDLQVDLIFLDDDPLITSTWELACSLKNIQIKTFNDVAIFLDNIKRYSKLTSIYIDSDLNHDFKGEEIARDLYMMGYRTLHLVTGKSKEDFSGLYWIKSIDNKKCPYVN